MVCIDTVCFFSSLCLILPVCFFYSYVQVVCNFKRLFVCPFYFILCKPLFYVSAASAVEWATFERENFVTISSSYYFRFGLPTFLASVTRWLYYFSIYEVICNIKISPILYQFCPSTLNILPNKKWTIKHLPKTCKILPLWRNLPNLVTLLPTHSFEICI